MNALKDKWKIFQTDQLEYILLSNGNNSQKIKGNNAIQIVDVIDEIQNSSSHTDAKANLKTRYDENTVTNIFEWLSFNKFLNDDKQTGQVGLNIIGEFSNDEKLLRNFINTLPTELSVKSYVNLSKTNKVEIIKGFPTLLIAPFWHKQENINTIAKLMVESGDDFLYVELYNNGVSLGPLLNSSKGTACLSCIEKRKLFNTSNPTLILENIIDKNILTENKLSVFEIGHFDSNKIFIYNELKKLICEKNKSMYSKSVFIDLNKYENSQFRVIKTPNCEMCNPQIIYNPL